MRKYLIDQIECKETLEYEWEGFNEVWLFSTKNSLKEVNDWYLEKFCVQNSNKDAGKSEFYFSDETEKIVVSVICADIAEEAAVSDLISYIGSKKLQKMITPLINTVGALFIHTNG